MYLCKIKQLVSHMVEIWRYNNVYRCVIDDSHIKMSERLCVSDAKRKPNFFLKHDFGFVGDSTTDNFDLCFVYYSRETIISVL